MPSLPPLPLSPHSHPQIPPWPFPFSCPLCWCCWPQAVLHRTLFQPALALIQTRGFPALPSTGKLWLEAAVHPSLSSQSPFSLEKLEEHSLHPVSCSECFPPALGLPPSAPFTPLCTGTRISIIFVICSVPLASLWECSHALMAAAHPCPGKCQAPAPVPSFFPVLSPTFATLCFSLLSIPSYSLTTCLLCFIPYNSKKNGILTPDF